MASKTVTLLVTLILLYSSHNDAVSDFTNEERALLKWQASFGSQTNLISASWDISNIMCSWYGISCNSAGSIIRINLTNSSLVCTLFQFPFSSLPNLSHLELSMNRVFGNIPPEIGQLSKLVYLDLSYNHLKGLIPPSLSNLSNLVYLYLSTNELFSSLPSNIGNLSNLVEFHVDTNYLTGEIPSAVGSLKNLVVLNLADNMLSGSIPSELGNLKSLSMLTLQRNDVSGSIPASLGNLPELRILRLADNHIYGFIPEEIDKLKSLVDLDLSRNLIRGYIPSTISNLSNLQSLYLYSNLLSGNISEYFTSFPKMQNLNFEHNAFYGQFQLNCCRQLTMLRIAGNNINGTIPPDIGNLTQLRILDFSSNNLVGEIPKELGKLTFLLSLILSNNKFSGDMSSELGLLIDLEYLDLSINNLSQSVPKCFGNFSHLHYMNLSNNQLTKEIPDELGMLVQLNDLDLSFNLLTGEIPSKLSELQSLATLNLSRNNLSGAIPSTFSEMHGLLYVDVSYNNLHGPVPENKAFQNSSLVGNKGLCGNVTGLQPCKENNMHNRVTRKYHKNMLVFIVCFTLVGSLLLSSANFAFWYFKTKPNKNGRKHSVGNTLTIAGFDGKKLYEEIIKSTNNFDESYCIGAGGSGRVYKVDSSFGYVFAVKKLYPLGDSMMVDEKAFQRKIKALTEIRHRNIVKFFGSCSYSEHSFLVYRYVQMGTLGKFLRNNEKAKTLDWEMRMSIIRDVGRALLHIHHEHEPPIVHRDITSNNILLDADYVAQVSDFGTAKPIYSGVSNWTDPVGSIGYAAPGAITVKCDVFSFGVIVLEVIKGRHPGDFIHPLSSRIGYRQFEYAKLLDQRLPHPTRTVKKQLVHAMKVAFSCLVDDPRSRPSMSSIFNLLNRLETEMRIEKKNMESWRFLYP